MMQIIETIVEDKKYEIKGALSEHFDELKGKIFMFNDVAAEQIEMLDDLSITVNFLLSAVAGTVI